MAVQWLEKWWKDRTCPICGHNTWSITNVFEMREYRGGELVLGNQSQLFPVFLAVCTTCGYTNTFNAIVAGIAKAKR